MWGLAGPGSTIVRHPTQHRVRSQHERSALWCAVSSRLDAARDHSCSDCAEMKLLSEIPAQRGLEPGGFCQARVLRNFAVDPQATRKTKAPGAAEGRIPRSRFAVCKRSVGWQDTTYQPTFDVEVARRPSPRLPEAPWPPV